MDRIFEASGLLVMPFWGLMILFPFARITERVMRAPVAPALAAGLYAVLVLPRVPALLPLLARPTLAGIAPLLGSPEGATLAWIHFLAFDLFVGRWIHLDARERRISAWISSPVLCLTLMFGPLGLLMHLLVRAVAGRRAGGPVPLGGQP